MLFQVHISWYGGSAPKEKIMNGKLQLKIGMEAEVVEFVVAK